VNFDIRTIPFSRYGSFLVFSNISGRNGIKDGLYLRNIRGGDEDLGLVFLIELTYLGKTIPYEEIATPDLLKLKTNHGMVEICIPDYDVIRIRSKNIGLRLTLNMKKYDNIIPLKNGKWEITSYSQEIKFMLSKLRGNIHVDAPWEMIGNSHVVINLEANDDNEYSEIALESYKVVWEEKKYDINFEDCRKKVWEEYNNWLENTLPVPKEFEPAKELASYITWSCVVKPEGNLTRPAMYMSNNWMTNIWSWDNCFNAMALAKKNPVLALEQLMIFIDNQHSSGVFPDFINDKYLSWSCTKPPIHGWAFKWMMERNEYFKQHHILKQIYKPLSKWTNYWLKYRDDDNDGVPQYNHGNDSGWDNSTIFDKGTPVESPDLCAFLVLQMDLLAEIADKFNKTEETKGWRQLSDITLEKMIKNFWEDDKFIATFSGSPDYVKDSDSLILYMPIILGKKLPEKIRLKLIEGLKQKDRFLTGYGFATESISSRYYKSDGYWRGPIWAPSTMLLVDGLMKAEEKEFAKEVAQRFCKMALKSGMAENFNALTGEALCDPAFTWTSSVFLILGNEYLDMEIA
jgi:glycogen debranching enzyme